MMRKKALLPSSSKVYTFTVAEQFAIKWFNYLVLNLLNRPNSSQSHSALPMRLAPSSSYATDLDAT